MIQFPEDPHDGMQLIDYVDEFTVVIWTYNEQNNQWTSKEFGTPENYVFTDQVLVRDNIQELPERADTDPSELKTQKDVNWYLNENGGGGEIGPQGLIQCTRIAPPEGTAMTTYEGSTNHPQSIQTRTAVEGLIQDNITVQEDLSKRVSDGETKQAAIEERLEDVPSLSGTNTFEGQNQFNQPVRIAAGASAQHAVNNAGLQAANAALQDSINQVDGKTGHNSSRLDEIDERFNELDRSLAVGRWRYLSTGSKPNPNNGEFTLTKHNGDQPTRNWQDVAFASISKVDSAGVTHEIQEWKEGDRFEIYSTMDDGHAVFTLGNYAGLDTQLVFTNLLEFYGAPQDRLEYRIRRHAAGDGIGFDEAEQRYVNVAGDDMTGPLDIKGKSASGAVFRQKNQADEDVLVLKQTDNQNSRLDVQAGKDFSLFHVGANKTFISTKNNLLELNYLREPTNGGHAATRNYADTKIKSTSGSAKTDLTLRGADKDHGMFSFKAAKPSDWENNTPFGIDFDISQNNTYRSRLTFSVRGNETAYTLYKDNTEGTVHKFSGNLYKGSVNTDNRLLTEKQIREVISTEMGASLGGPARIFWKFNRDSSETPADGHFNCSQGNVNGSNIYYFSRVTGNGWEFFERNDMDIANIVNGTQMTIWDTPDKWRWKGSTSVSKVEFTSQGFIKVTCGSFGNSPAALTEEGTYYVTIGGIF